MGHVELPQSKGGGVIENDEYVALFNRLTLGDASPSTRPSLGDSTGISIFIDSSTSKTSSSSTELPALVSTFHTLPAICASTSILICLSF